MSEEENTNNGRIALSITSDEFVEFLKHKSVPTFCPVCRNFDTQVSVIHNTEESKPYILQIPVVSKNNLGMWFFALGCENCGYTQYFNVQTVELYVRAKRKESEDRE